MHKPDKHRRDPDSNIDDLVFITNTTDDSVTQKTQSEIG
jgi:hypothetical protein